MDFATKLGMLSSAPRGPAQRDRDAASGAAEPMVNVADGVGVTPGRADLALLVPERQTRFGALHLVQQLHPCTLRWCGQAVASLALGREWADVDPERLLFLDTETTGLSGGTGTLAFLVGTASFEGAGLQVEQLHLPRPGHERPMLQWLHEKVERASALVTFNGKSFDWPLLRSRWVMNRLPVPRAPPHLDLLHCARRVFRFQLDETRLGTLEKAVLGHHRAGDIDGADIPGAWFDFLRTGRVATLARVLEHNARDVVSLAALLEHLTGLWRHERPAPPATALGLASVAMRVRDDERAIAFAERAAESTEPKVRMRALELDALTRRRRGDFGGAARSLEEALRGGPTEPALHLALAKLYEHQLRDLDAARHHAERSASSEGPQAAARRRARLWRNERSAI